jgi:hypothetical protein
MSSRTGENEVKKRGKLASGFLSLIMGNGKLRIVSAFLAMATIWHMGITPFWNIGINTFITLGILMFVAFLAGTFFKKWAFPFSSLLILLQLSGLFYINFEHIDFIKKGKNVPTEYNVFMNMTLSMIVVQLMIMITAIGQSLKPKLFKINNWLVTSIFLLSSILCSIAIGQIWVILKKLKCDC